MVAKASSAVFPASLPRREKRLAGATSIPQTPLAIRTIGVHLSPAFRQEARVRLAQKLGRYADRIERLTLRFEDINGPRGGVDIVCRAKVVLSGLESVLVEEKGIDHAMAFQALLAPLVRAVRKTLDRAQRAAVQASAKVNARLRAGEEELSSEPLPDAGSLIGRRVGRALPNRKAALARPEKEDRTHPVDTAAPGTSATHRKAGGSSTARRNAKRVAPKATATLEDSRSPRPSRKSTRKSANRAKGGTALERRATAKARAPKRRASKP